MASVGLSAEDAEALLKSQSCTTVVVACDNSPKNVTLSGKINLVFLGFARLYSKQT